MESTRIAIFAATLFAIGFSSYMYCISLGLHGNRTKITASTISIAVLAVSMLAGLIAANLTSPVFAQVGCILLLSISAVRRVLEIRNNTLLTATSTKSATLFLSTDALVAGFGAGLGGINILATLILCIILHTVFIRFATTDSQSRSSLSTLGAILFISLAILL